MEFKTHREFFENIFREFLNKEYNDKDNPGTWCRILKTPKEMATKAIDYFCYCEENNRAVSYAGLRLHLKLWSREAWQNYANGNTKQYTEDFKEVCNIIKIIIEDNIVQKLYRKDTVNAAKFDLAANWGWTVQEKQIIENHNIEVSIGKKNASE